MVKDLWALRLQLVQGRIDDEFEANAVFSSQPETQTGAESKHDDGGREWKVCGEDLPSLVETLGLCYLGMILLRLPVGLGELHRYVLTAFKEVSY